MSQTMRAATNVLRLSKRPEFMEAYYREHEWRCRGPEAIDREMERRLTEYFHKKRDSWNSKASDRLRGRTA